MSKFFSSDHHLGHLRIPELAGRPFTADAAGVAEMNRELIRRHNEVVRPWDEVFVLGDFAMGTIAETLPLVKEMNGDIVLVAGNHDRCSPCYGDKWPDWVPKYLEAGFYGVQPMDGANPYLADMVKGIGVHVSHFPYLGSGQDSRTGMERYPGHRPIDHGGWLLCGHVHNRWRQHGKMINVGVDAWGGYPVTEDQLAEMMSLSPRNLEVLEWILGRAQETDWVYLHPAVRLVKHVAPRHRDYRSDNGNLDRTMITRAGALCVSLGNRSDAHWLQHQVTMLLGYVYRVDHARELVVQPKQDVQVSVCLMPDNFYRASHSDTVVDDLEPIWVINMVPE